MAAAEEEESEEEEEEEEGRGIGGGALAAANALCGVVVEAGICGGTAFFGAAFVGVSFGGAFGGIGAIAETLTAKTELLCGALEREASVIDTRASFGVADAAFSAKDLEARIGLTDPFVAKIASSAIDPTFRRGSRLDFYF